MNRRAFTLIEMLVATVLSAVLMTAVLAALAGVARDRRVLRSLPAAGAATTADLIAWDIGNARVRSPGGPAEVLVLVGNGGIRRRTMTPDGRLVRVTYRAAGGALWRQQEYLDDPARPDRWQELVAGDFRGLSTPASGGDTPIAEKFTFAVAVGRASAQREVTR